LVKSITFGDLTWEQVFKIIKEYISQDPLQNYKITVGTDSQNHEMTKIALVVSVYKVGKGGIFFYDIRKVHIITNLRQKLFYETGISLELANLLAAFLKKESSNYNVSIHVDAGENGPSAKMIPEIVDWVKECGFECKTKPYSYTASTIANKMSK
jgi:uncharacterized protein